MVLNDYLYNYLPLLLQIIHQLQTTIVYQSIIMFVQIHQLQTTIVYQSIIMFMQIHQRLFPVHRV
jgi:hypothetical protein